MKSDKIVLSGMRPTGKLHLGNFHGALKNWVALQDKYNCYFFVADLHSLTTAYDHTENLAANSEAMLIDWLTAGLDPQNAPFYPVRRAAGKRTQHAARYDYAAGLAA